ncbi:MAG: dNTP triphosphohydrolase [Bacteroidales bacterium]|nr:dNTP triphosphohydrolase [Bacteroidales bacterium]
MEWKKLLSGKRVGMEKYHERKHDRTNFQRDYDRLIFSSPFRRLQNKTQVFPLPGSIFVHNRLTHSLEVSCVGRSLGSNVARELSMLHPEDSLLFNEIDSIVAAACLAHDLGNPPFGHSGENAMGTYFSTGNGQSLEMDVRREGGRWEDFTFFEGNANAIRLLTHKFLGRRDGGFAMTYATLSSITKYPYASSLCGEKRKFGFFQSEEDTYRNIARELGISPISETPLHYHRHPLVFLVEAADDICYQIMDIEDAHKLRILTTGQTIDLLMNYFDTKRKESVHNVLKMVSDPNEQIAYLRSCVIGILVDECSRVFVENEEAILKGIYTTPLIKKMSTPVAEAYEKCSETAFAKIYRSKEVLDVELVGFRIITVLLEEFISAVNSPESTYSKLLLRRVSSQYDINATSAYGKIQSVLDYISGMTDIYALDLYKKITGMNIPVL